MHSMKKLLLALVAVGVFALVGCGTQATNTGRVAVIDLDNVAKQLGRDVVMTSELKEHEDTLNTKLKQVQVAFQSKLDEETSAVGETPSDEQMKSLTQLQRSANLQLNQVRSQAQLNLNQRKAELVRKFREEASLHAKRVAAEQGLSIVITKIDNLILTFDDAVDITDAVAERMKSVPAKAVSSNATVRDHDTSETEVASAKATHQR
jgi:Skp family chaperone for outer membrane proteins